MLFISTQSWRGVRWFRWMRATTLVVTLALSCLFMYTLYNDPRWFDVDGLAIVFSLALYLSVPAYSHFVKRQYRARLAAIDGLACTRCGYQVDPELDGKRCPECGAQIDLAAMRESWVKAVGTWKR